MNSMARRRRYPRVMRFANGSIICGASEIGSVLERYHGSDVRWFDVYASLDDGYMDRACEMTPQQVRRFRRAMRRGK